MLFGISTALILVAAALGLPAWLAEVYSLPYKVNAALVAVMITTGIAGIALWIKDGMTMIARTSNKHLTKRDNVNSLALLALGASLIVCQARIGKQHLVELVMESLENVVKPIAQEALWDCDNNVVCAEKKIRWRVGTLYPQEHGFSLLEMDSISQASIRAYRAKLEVLHAAG